MIIPAIIAKDFDEVEEKVEQVENSTEWVHLDNMDGLFTPVESWPYFDIKEAPKDLEYIDFIRTDNVKAEIHLMTKHPEKNLEKWVDAGADRILFHYESTTEAELDRMLTYLEDVEGVEAGIVLKYETPIDVLDKFIDDIDVVQLMSISHIGFYGHPLEEGIYAKIRDLRAKYPGVTINVDGGINLENAKMVMDAGADNLVIGSAIFNNDDPARAIKEFKNSL